MMSDMLNRRPNGPTGAMPIADARNRDGSAILTATVRRASVFASAGTAP
jgi:hypothetical protein